MSQDNSEIIFRPWITRNGKRIYAKQFGLRAFPIRVKPGKPKKKK